VRAEAACPLRVFRGTRTLRALQTNERLQTGM
jgi:hypothetical protein